MKTIPFFYRISVLLVFIVMPSLLRVTADVTPSTGASTFIVKDGAFPWADRVNVWQLLGVPASLAGNGPLPQQDCTSRSIMVPDGTKSVIFAVATTDADKLKSDIPAAQATGDSISVAHADGTNIIPYTVFKLDSPPATIGDSAFGAGVIILQVSDKPAKGNASTNAPPTPPKK